jgi:hypothetical protein
MIIQIVRGAAAMIVGYGAIVGLTCLGFNGFWVAAHFTEVHRLFSWPECWWRLSPVW